MYLAETDANVCYKQLTAVL